MRSNKDAQSTIEISKKRKIFSMVSFAVLLILIIGGTVFLWRFFARFQNEPENLKIYLNSFGFWGGFVFVFMQILQVVFPIIPGELLELGAGFMYGPWLGLLLCQIGTGLASCFIFLLVRRFGRPFLGIFMDTNSIDRFKFLHNNKKLTLVVFLLFFIPGTPKDLITYFVGLTKIKTAHFLLITIFARIPSVLSSTLIGASFGEKQYLLMAVFIALTLFVSLGGVLYYRKISKEENAKDTAGSMPK